MARRKIIVKKDRFNTTVSYGKNRTRLYETLPERWVKNTLSVLLISFLAVYAIPHIQEVAEAEVVTKEVEKLIVVRDVTLPAVLHRIAKCESNDQHYGKTGQVLVVGNKNGTVDIGRYAINNYYWGAEATEMGLDLFDEKDNETMALYIFKEKGTSPWEATAHCWK